MTGYLHSEERDLGAYPIGQRTYWRIVQRWTRRAYWHGVIVGSLATTMAVLVLLVLAVWVD